MCPAFQSIKIGRMALNYSIPVSLVVHLLVINYVIALPSHPDYPAIASTHLAKLALVETKLVGTAKNEINQLQSQLALYQEYVQDYELGSIAGKMTPWDLVANPVASYAMIRRFAYHIPKLRAILNTTTESGLEILLNEDEPGREWTFPNRMDQAFALETLLKLQFIYGVPAKSMANGVLSTTGSTTGVALSAKAVKEIVTFIVSDERYSAALDWIQLLEELEPNLNLSMGKLKERVVAEHDLDYESKRANGHRYIFDQPLLSSTQPSTAVSMRNILLHSNKSGTATPEAVAITKLKLCNGKDLRNETVRASLYCWLQPDHYFGPLQPLQVEQLATVVHLFHGFLPISLAKQITTSTLPLLNDQIFRMVHPSLYTETAVRFDNELRLGRRVALGLAAFDLIKYPFNQTEEETEISLYPMGGDMDLHDDFANSTLLIYLSSVELGGATVFPDHGISIQPKAGDALHYINYVPQVGANGTSHLVPVAMHGACPVLHGGVKWVAGRATT